MPVRWPFVTPQVPSAWILGGLLFAVWPAATTELNAAPVGVLDTTGFWRIHQTFRPPDPQVLALEPNVIIQVVNSRPNYVCFVHRLTLPNR